MTKKPVSKTNKVYRVHTSLLESEDCANWSSYTIVAVDAETAISSAKEHFQKNEYAESVDLICILDE